MKGKSNDLTDHYLYSIRDIRPVYGQRMYELVPSVPGQGYVCSVTFSCQALSDTEMVLANASKWLQEPSSPQLSGEAELPYDCLHLTT